MKKGIIKDISNYQSGLQTIMFNDGSKVSIENFGIRQLNNAFDDNPIGETIYYDVDEYNIMTGFDLEQTEKEDEEMDDNKTFCNYVFEI